jgi:hypothetical protein
VNYHREGDTLRATVRCGVAGEERESDRRRFPTLSAPDGGFSQPLAAAPMRVR